MNRQALFCLALVMSMPAMSNGSAWEDYNARLGKQCPGRHADRIGGGAYLDLLASFESSLPRAMAQRIERQADLQRVCANEEMGFGCEMGRSIDTYRQLGLLRQFVTYTCRHVRCEEPAICSQLPKPPHG